MKLFINIGVLIPLAWVGWQVLTGQLGANPITTLEQTSGRIALSLLTLTLAITPLAAITRQPAFLPFRLWLGLYSFLYASLHVFILVILDYGGNIPLLISTFINKPFIWAGMGTFLILVFLALSSLNTIKKKMGTGWKVTHRLIYLGAILALVHYLLVVKGSLATLSGNLARPLVYAAIILTLLTARIVIAWRVHSTSPQH